ncbi:SGNH/GDSL hydrolase family protein [Candidatus Pacearchaeota archaeon]|nr:SGNH/GDSL hydrolase family protein [Candidatus Pacearchaeota archaeon]
MKQNSNWFANHPIITTMIIMMLLLLFIELLMHGTYLLNILPKNVIYMTQLEKADYRDNVNTINYEDFVPRRANGYSNYIQREIPPQYIKFDDTGMREDNYISTSQGDKIIGVFGDSYTDALQVGQLDAYPALLEEKLRNENCDVDVRNYGLGATGTSVQYLRYKQRKQKGEKFDYIILTLFQNDIINNNQALDQLFPKSYQHYPYFVLKNGKLIRSDWHAPRGKQAWKHVKTFFQKYSHFANTIFNIRTIYASWKNTQVKSQAGDQTARVGQRTIMDNLYNPPTNNEWVNAWAVTEAIIKQWHSESIRDNEKFLLILLTESVQLDKNKKNTTLLNYDYPNKRLSKFAKHNNIEIIDFLPFARKYVEDNRLKFPFLSWQYDGHYSQIGHKLLSNVISRQPDIKSLCGTYSSEVTESYNN